MLRPDCILFAFCGPQFAPCGLGVIARFHDALVLHGLLVRRRSRLAFVIEGTAGLIGLIGHVELPDSSDNRAS